MQYNNRDIDQLLDTELIQICKSVNETLAKRNAASKHDKFNKNIGTKKKMEFPPINPEYLKLKNALFDELNKRKLTLED